jgi:hypothetical protein
MMPEGLLVTVPLPVPDLVMLKANVVIGMVAQPSFEGLDTPLTLNARTR